MHVQIPPAAEAKLVRCSAGAIFDVVVDLRASSAQLTKWFGVELTAENRRMLYVPEGCAHGFQTLVDDSEVVYQISEYYRPDSARGVRWDDPIFAVSWPHEAHRTMSESDAAYPDFSPRRDVIHL